MLSDEIILALSTTRHTLNNHAANANAQTERLNILEAAGGGGGGGGDFTQLDSSNSAFILNKPIITTSSTKTLVGVGAGANTEGYVTAFGVDSGKSAHQGHLSIGELSGELGATRAISIGYKAHANNVNSTVISGGSTALSSSENDAFYMEKLRILDPNGETLAHMKINMYNTNTKEIFNVDNLLVPGTCKINGGLTVGDVAPVININHTIIGQTASVPIVSLNATRIGDNAGQFSLFTKALGGSLTERLRINNLGAVGFGGSSSPNTAFGVAGQVLTSSHDGGPPVWKDKTRIVKFIGSGYFSPDGTGVNDGEMLYVKWPFSGGGTGWVSSNPVNTFCEEYGVSGSSNSTGADGSIKILEAGQYLINIKHVMVLHQKGFFVKGRLWKIPASNGANDFSSPTELGVTYLTTNYFDSQDDIMDVVLTHTELVDLTVGERLILALSAQGSKLSAQERTQIIIQKVSD
tara:strand:- start:807 stop:2201 length:1395 start_codon:yes stop_codon:yes gene_type:complete